MRGSTKLYTAKLYTTKLYTAKVFILIRFIINLIHLKGESLRTSVAYFTELYQMT
jgi:hypothetical protein